MINIIGGLLDEMPYQASGAAPMTAGSEVSWQSPETADEKMMSRTAPPGARQGTGKKGKKSAGRPGTMQPRSTTANPADSGSLPTPGNLRPTSSMPAL